MSNQTTAVQDFDASPARVFSAWLSPDCLVTPVVHLASDARVGGELRLRTDDAVMLGHFLKVEVNRRLVYTWSWQPGDEITLVDVTFHAAGERCVVEVHHAGFHSAASLERHRAGWAHYLKGVAAYL